MSYTAASGTMLGSIAGDREIGALLDDGADIAAILEFERALSAGQAAAGIVPQSAARDIARACDRYTPDLAAIGKAMMRDGVAVPELLRQLRAGLSESSGRHLHRGATSQDAIDTSMAMRMRDATKLLLARMQAAAGELTRLERRLGASALVSRTRLQVALPGLAADRIARWRRMLESRALEAKKRPGGWLALQYGGPAGRPARSDRKRQALAADLARRLGLPMAGADWQTDRGRVADFAGWLSDLTGAFGKIGQDIALMAQNGIDEIVLKDAGGSSAMPHKRNPARAEILVALARYNATLLSAIHHGLVHEFERSGAAWTLEWLVLPNMCLTAGAATRIGGELIGSIEKIGDGAGRK
jgi:3-carboxy-cis,cis-muconate cycloisomerase